MGPSLTNIYCIAKFEVTKGTAKFCLSCELVFFRRRASLLITQLCIHSVPYAYELLLGYGVPQLGGQTESYKRSRVPFAA